MFDHRGDGTAEERWEQAGCLEGAARLEVPGKGRHVVIVSAHPDDESLGAGGLIATAARRGARVEVIVATDGEASHPLSTSCRPAELALRRREEVREAVRRLGSRVTLIRLGLPDGRLRSCRPELERAIETRLSPGALLVTPWRGDRHPDHEACALAARSVARRRGDCAHWQYPIWAWHWADPELGTFPPEALGRLELDEGALSAKKEAISCHVSQHEALSPAPGDEVLLRREFLAHFRRRYETFVVEGPHRGGSEGYFDDLYSASDDPWDLAGRFYERRKRDLVMASLPRERFGRAFEPGCASGLLTRELARRCDEVVACDVASRPAELARRTTCGLENVSVEKMAVPESWPGGSFDLIVLSEVGYYCDDLDQLAEAVRLSLSPAGSLVACHWRHEAPEHPRSADEVHEAVGAGLKLLVEHLEEDFRLDVWTKTGESVARLEGIVS